MVECPARRLILTVGLPRSGKSSWAQAQGYPIVNVDSIRFAVYGCAGNIDVTREDECWLFARRMVVALFAAGHTDVILDATNLDETRRAEWLSTNWKTVLHLVPTDVATCKARAVQLGQDYLLPVIDRMHRRYTECAPPSPNDWEFV